MCWQLMLVLIIVIGESKCPVRFAMEELLAEGNKAWATNAF
jgi:hypothetical protein